MEWQIIEKDTQMERIQYHCVWKTKYSYKVLSGDIALRLRELLKEICSLRDIIIVRGNIRADHVHMLVKASSYLSPSKIAQYLKSRMGHALLK